MGNEISRAVSIGTIGELLVQLRLLQFGVQAAPPLKDSGNDLIAIRGESFRGVQIKTSTSGEPRIGRLPRHYHIVALVTLVGENKDLYLDQSNVFLLPRDLIESKKWTEKWGEYRICSELIDHLF